MQECDKRNSHITSKLHLIYVSSNNDRHRVTKIFTPIHYTSPTTLHSTSLYLSTLHFFPFKLPPTTLYYPFIWLNSTAPFHLTSLHFTSLNFTFRRFSPYFFSLHPICNCFPNSLSKNFRFTRESP